MQRIQSLLSTRYGWLLAGLALVYIGLLPSRWQCEGVDEIVYLSLADSLAAGEGYTVYGEPHGLYPPLFPAVLGGLMRAGGPGPHWRLLYAANLLLGLLGLGLGIRLSLRLTDAWGRVAALLSIAAYYGWSFSARYLMSEPLYLVLAMGALLLVHRITDSTSVKPSGWHWGWLGLLILAAAATRTAALVLTGAVGLAGLIRAGQGQVRRGMALAALAAVTGGVFFLAWEVRHLRIAPHSEESYLRWAGHLLGISEESGGIIAENRGEGVSAEQNTLLGRAGFLGGYLGQLLTGITRPPVNFTPLAALLAAALATGLGMEWRKRPGSPAGWYVAAGLGLALMTSWVSSYLRYGYVMLPLLFGFAGQGLGGILRASLRKRWIRALLSGVGLAGLAWSARMPVAWTGGAETLYRSVLGLALVGLYLGLVILPWVAAAKPSGAGWQRKLAVALVFGFVLHAAGQVAGRAVLIRREATLDHRNLRGLMDCADWIRRHTPAETVLVTTFPELVRYPAQRITRKPSGSGTLAEDPGTWFVQIGWLSDVPGMPWIPEQRFREDLADWVESGGAEVMFASADARVVRRRPAP